jgi:DNA-binding NtrC family response regulator
MDELGTMLRAAGAHVTARVHTRPETEWHLHKGVDLVFVSSEAPVQVMALAKLARKQLPAPDVVCVGEPATPEEMFQLGKAGVAAFLQCPLEIDGLRSCLALLDAEPTGELARALVGRIGLREAQRELRHSMVAHALQLCEGSRKAAARLLGVTRPAIQRVLRESDAPDANESDSTLVA